MLGHFLYRWLYLDFYVPVWPNLAAEVAVTAFIWSKLHAMHKLHRAHFDWHKDQRRDQ